MATYTVSEAVGRQYWWYLGERGLLGHGMSKQQIEHIEINILCYYTDEKFKLWAGFIFFIKKFSFFTLLPLCGFSSPSGPGNQLKD